MNPDSTEQQLIKLLRRIFSLYSIRSMVVLFALYLLLAPQAPLWMEDFDQWLFAQVATEEQQTLALQARNEREATYAADKYINNILGSIERISSGEGFEPRKTYFSLTPSWFAGAEDVAISLACVFLVFGMARVTYLTGLWCVLGTIATVLVVQLGALNLSSVWLPFGVAIQFLIVGYLMMLLWLRPAKEAKALKDSRHAIALAHGALLIEQGLDDYVLKTLRYCHPTGETLKLAYRFATAQEKKHQYESAIAAYQLIMESDAKYEDVKARLKKIQDTFKQNDANKLPLNLQATMAINAAGQPVLGRYQIQRELGRGAMGIVYLGTDPKISRQVAIKTLNYKLFESRHLTELRERFFREAEAAGRLNHPNIVTIYDVGEEADLAFIAMDYIEGVSLEKHAHPGELLPIKTVYKIVLQVAEALGYAHERNVIHRDIKPSNLIYNPDTGQVKVSDFGIARFSDESKTRTGHVMGSPIYMSPEQLKGNAITGRADVFSLGATFYQLLTGETPFSADSLPELTIQIMSKKHRSVRDVRSDLPGSAVRITNKALQKDPGSRFQNAAEMADQLRKALEREVA